MDEFNILPIYQVGLDEIMNGRDIKVPEFCRKNCRKEKCKKFYEELFNKEEGLYECPYGFSSYIFTTVEENKCIFTCLRVKNKYDQKKLIPKIKREAQDYKEINEKSLKKYVIAYKQYAENSIMYNRHKKFVEETFHDVRKFTGGIRAKNTRIRKAAEASKNKGKFLELSKSIEAYAWFLTLRINNYDFTYCNDMIEKDISIPRNIYGLFYKTKQCVSERLNEKGIKIKMDSNRQCREVNTKSSIEVLPFIIIDNAIKYSPNNENIYIDIKETLNQQHITITSIGPKLNDVEKDNICERGYRGANAEQITSEGSGIGLYVAKKICESNNIKIDFYSDERIKYKKNNIEYSEFKCEFCMEIQ